MQRQKRVTQIGWRWAALLVVLSLILAACAPVTAPAPGASSGPEAAPESGGEETAAETTTETEAAMPGGEVSREDTLVYAVDLTDIITLDPGVAYEFGSILPVGQLYETLLSFNPGEAGVLLPLLAESWDVQDTGDNWTMTFKLDPDAKFASGNAVTANDVIFSWGRAIDINKSPIFLLNDVCQITKENLAAGDDGTLEVKIPKLVSPQVCLAVLTFSVAAVVEQAAVEPNMGSDFGESWLNDNSAGSGPYILNKWDRSVSVTLDANANYWAGAAPAMKRVIIQNIPELVNIQAAIETGDADIVAGLGSDQTAVLEGNPDVALVKGLNTQLAYIGMNATKPPLDNPDVREAIRYAINYDDLVTLTGGNIQIVQEILPIGFLGHTGVNPFTPDIDKAKELLAGAGVAEGTEIEFLVPTGTALGGIDSSTLAAKLKDDIEKTGLVLNIKQLETSELLNIYRAQEAQLVQISWGPDFPDPDGNATPFANFEAHSLAWRNAWEDATAIELSKAAAIELDSDKRVEMYKELVEYMQHNGPYAMLYQPTTIFGLRSNVQGFVYDPNDTPSVSFWLISKQ